MRVSIFGMIALGTVFGVLVVLDVVSGQRWGWGEIVGGGLALSGAVVAVRVGRSPR